MDRRGLLRTGTGAAVTAALLRACGREDPGKAPSDDGTSAAGTPSADGRGSGGRAEKARDQDWSALGRGLDGRLVRPGDADYATARQLYNTRFDGLRPAAVAYVAGAADITECLAFARRHAAPVAIRNGGHSYGGWSSGDGRLIIDVSKLGTVRGGSEARIGAGAKLIDIYTRLGAEGRGIPGGSCPTVGISGLTLGGGHGVVSRAHGLTCDSLTAATLITADGRTLHCDGEQNADLFRALRGAGTGNFGVVTELRFRTHEARQGVTAQLRWDWNKAAALLRSWQEWGPEQPDEIWSALHLGAKPGQSPTVSVSAFSLGTYGDLQNAVDRLADAPGGPGPASAVDLRRRSYQEAMLGYAGCSTYSDDQCHLPGPTPGRRANGALGRETYAARSDFFDRSLNAEGVRTLIDRLERYGRGSGGGEGDTSVTVGFTALGGAVNRVRPSATSFVHRRSRFLAQYLVSWPAGGAGKTPRSWLAGVHGAMRRHASGAAYQNYPDPDLGDWRRAYYGDAAGGLAELKRKYDPERLFDFPQGL